MTAPAITLTPAEVANYYRARIPKLAQRGKQWRGTCPIHAGRSHSFAVDAESGRWFCHSTCGRGGDAFDLEMALTGAKFNEAKSAVSQIVGRVEPEYHRSAGKGFTDRRHEAERAELLQAGIQSMAARTVALPSALSEPELRSLITIGTVEDPLVTYRAAVRRHGSSIEEIIQIGREAKLRNRRFCGAVLHLLHVAERSRCEATL